MQLVSLTQFMILSLSGIGYAANSSQRKFFRLISFDNLFINGSTQSPGSIADCVRGCVNDPLCVSFFFNDGKGTCTLHSDEIPSNTHIVADEGSRFYSKEGNCSYLTKGSKGGSFTAEMRRDCYDIKMIDPSSENGVYTINPEDGQGPFQVYCDMTTDGGGWTVFQRRVDGTEDFGKSWDVYEQGFGDESGEFWLGNNKINRLTTARASQLRIDMLNESNATGFAKYSTFSVDNETEMYTLHVSGFSGDMGDGTAHLDGRRFFTKEQLGSAENLTHCADVCMGGWWYGNCSVSNLNGIWGLSNNLCGMTWQSSVASYILKGSEMKFKPY